MAEVGRHCEGTQRWVIVPKYKEDVEFKVLRPFL
jgi:hypothetical protein